MWEVREPTDASDVPDFRATNRSVSRALRLCENLGMRHPDADRIRDACRAALRPVLEHANLPADLPLELDHEGWVNVCFLGADVVVRFNARDPDVPKFHREEWAYQVRADRGFPVPRLIAHVDDPDVAPYPVLIAERLAGENLEATWPRLRDDARRRLAAQAGEWLARLHRQPFTGFGEVVGSRRATQREFWSAWADTLLGRCRPLFDLDEVRRFGAAIAAASPRLDLVTESRFVHRDYHFGNLLHDGGDIVGILDFEWSMASDPAIDRSKWRQLDEVTPGAFEPFVTAYEAEHGAVDDDPVLLGLYRTCGNLELCDVAARFLSEAESVEYRDRTLAALARFESLLEKH
jgi:aminoglycoside phosphotransferase (APT) family kinase protein